MTDRRSFLKTGAISAGAATLLAQQPAAAVESAGAYSGPRAMPHGLTLLSIRQADGAETLGVKTGGVGAGNVVLDVRSAAGLLGLQAPSTLDQMLAEGSAAQVERLVTAARQSATARAAYLDEATVDHGRLFRNPGKIICIGLNYGRHALETGFKAPRTPILFNKYNNSLAGHQAVIQLPPREISYKFDYETELLVVMGRHARNVPESEALQYVAGYAVGQDFSARDLQFELDQSQWMIGKTLDNFAPIGPYFVSADLVGDPGNLKIETLVNGEVRQSSTTSDMLFNTQQIISFISRHWALEPGDLIFTGTPPGVIQGYPKDKQVWLKAGDKVVSTIEKLGELHFTLA